MSPDAMTARLHLRRIRVLEVLVDLVEELVLAIGDLRRVVRRRCCGFTTASAHDRRCYQVCDLPTPLPAVGPLRPPLSTDRIEALGKVLQIRPELGAGWRMLQHLYGINLAADSDEANQALGAFIATYHQPPAPPPRVRKTHRNVVGVGDEIFAFHDTDRITNGPSKAPASPTLRTVPQRLVAHGMSPPTTNTKDEENRSASNVENGLRATRPTYRRNNKKTGPDVVGNLSTEGPSREAQWQDPVARALVALRGPPYVPTIIGAWRS